MIILYIYVYIIHNIYQGKNTCPKDKRHPLTQLIHIRGYTHRYIYIYIYVYQHLLLHHQPGEMVCISALFGEADGFDPVI
jgi:hypothetical protein